MTAQLLWHDWFPSVWLDEHQMGSNGARIFVMPATDPINPNVHPLIYRWNGDPRPVAGGGARGGRQEGIIYNSTYTNFWQGAMAWSGWWHNQVGLLTEVASARIAAPIDQQRDARAGPRQRAGAGTASGRRTPRRCERRRATPAACRPTDITPRTEYPRPWMGGRWTLRDIVDYEMIATMALLETAADRRETLLRQIYEVNRHDRRGRREGRIRDGDPHPGRDAARPARGRAPGREAADGRRRGLPRRRGVRSGREDVAAGTFVMPMTQVFARYAKDMLEKQTYPEVRRSPDVAAGTALRRHRVVARHAARRRAPRSSEQRSLPAVKMTKLDGRAEARRATSPATDPRFVVRLQRPGRRRAHQPAAQGRRRRRSSSATIAPSRVARHRRDRGPDRVRPRRTSA